MGDLVKVHERYIDGELCWADGAGGAWRIRSLAEDSHRLWAAEAARKTEAPKKAEIIAHYAKTIKSLAAKEFLNEIGNDQEHVHREADRVLILALKELGLGEIAEAWEHVKEAVGFWYS